MPARNPPAIPDDPRAAEESIVVVDTTEEDARPRIIPAWLARELGEPLPARWCTRFLAPLL